MTSISERTGRKEIQYSSFVRQLNMHGFRKSCSTTAEMFFNKFFQRDRVDLDTYIFRKGPNIVVVEAPPAAVPVLRTVSGLSKRSRIEFEDLQDQVETLKNKTRQLERSLAAAEANSVLQQTELLRRQQQLEKMSAAWDEGVRSTRVGIDDALDTLKRYRLYVPPTILRQPEGVEDMCICSLAMLGGDRRFCVCMAASTVYEENSKGVFFDDEY